MGNTADRPQLQIYTLQFLLLMEELLWKHSCFTVWVLCWFTFTLVWVILELPSLHLIEKSKNINFISFELHELTTLHFRCEKLEGTFLSYAPQELK